MHLLYIYYKCHTHYCSCIRRANDFQKTLDEECDELIDYDDGIGINEV